MSRIPSEARSLPALLLAGAGIVVILALGWFFWSRGLEATQDVASVVSVGAPEIAPPRLPAPKLPDLPVPRPQ